MTAVNNLLSAKSVSNSNTQSEETQRDNRYFTIKVIQGYTEK